MTKGFLVVLNTLKSQVSLDNYSLTIFFASNAFVDSLEGKIFEDFQNKNTFGFVCCPLVFFNNVAQATEDYHICDIH